MARMKRIGIEPGKSFDFEQARPGVKKALERAPEEAQKLMKWKLPTLARVANDWSMNTDTMGVYGNYYLKRAIVTQLGLGANLPEDAIYPLNLGDEAGKPLDGASNYTIHFDKGDIPPVDAFWSITLYDRQGLPGRQRPQSLRRQQLDAVQVQSGRLPRPLLPERKPGRGQGSQLAAGAKGALQPDHAPLRAQERRVDRQMESAAGRRVRKLMAQSRNNGSRAKSSSGISDRSYPIMTHLTKPVAVALAGALMLFSAPAAEAAEWPGIETKAIAEEGFIYGLPIVMNYAVMYEYAVDKNSGPVQGTVQPDQQRGPRLHLQGHGGRHAQQRHALFVPVAGPARRADGDSVPAVEKERYYSVQLEDGNTFNYGYIGSRATGNEAGDYHGRRPRLEGRDARGHQEGVSLRDAVLARGLPHAALQSGRHAERRRRSRPATRPSRFRPILKQPAPPAAPTIDFPEDRQGDGEEEFLRVPRLRAAVRARRVRRRRKSAPSLPSIGIGAGQDLRLQGPLAGAQGGVGCWA